MDNGESSVVARLADVIDRTASLDNVGGYGEGGEVFDHYVFENASEVALAVLDFLRSLPVEQRMEAMGMQAKVWHFVMDFDPHPECNARCRTVWEEVATDG